MKRHGPSMNNPPKKGRWSEALLRSMSDPTERVMEDIEVVVIKDKYPKARYHYLVLPKTNVDGISHLNKSHISLLKHMDEVGRKLAKQHPDYEFTLGYHAVPSMQRLHLHVVSTDFDSPCLKTKHHWNSFTTEFFRKSEDVMREVEEMGRPKGTSSVDSLLRAALKCHKCSATPKNMPELKEHLLTHKPRG